MTTQTEGLILLDENVVNALPGTHEYTPEIAIFPDGSYLMVYRLYTNDGSSVLNEIYLQRFNADGSEDGDQVLVNSYSSGNQVWPDVITFDDGSYLVTWSSDGQDGSGYGIYAQRFDPSGNKVGGEQLVNQGTYSSQVHSDSTVLDDGSFVITWQSFHNGTYDIYARIYNADSSPKASEFLVNTYQSNDQEWPAITAIDNGFVVTWMSNWQDGSGWGIYSQEFDINGLKIGSEIRVNDTVSDNQQHNDVARLVSGDLVYAWSSQNQQGSNSYTDIVVKTLASDGTTSGEIVVGTTTYAQHLPSIVELNDGGFVVTWNSNHEGQNHIYAQRFNADASLNGGEIRISAASLDAFYPEVTELSNGDLLFTWHGRNPDNGTNDIYTRTVSAPGNEIQTSPIDGLVATSDEFVVNDLTNDNRSDQTEAKVAELADGGYVIVYETEQGQNIAAQRFDATGNKVGGEFVVNTTNHREGNPEVVGLSDGGFVVSWVATDEDGVSFQRFDDQGIAVGNEVTLAFARNSNTTPALTVLDNGNFVLTWNETVGASGSEVFAQIYDVDGNLIKGTFQVSQGLSGSEQHPSISALSDGGFLITFDLPDDAGLGVAAQRYDADGNTFGPLFQVNDHLPNYQQSSSVTGLENGGYVIAWKSNDQVDQSSESDVVFKLYDETGVSTGEVVLSAPGLHQYNVEVTALADGGFVIVYEAGGSFDWNVFAQRYNADGSLNGDQIQVNQTAGSDRMPDVAELVNGDLVFTWHGTNPDSLSSDVFARTFAAPGNIAADENTTPTAPANAGNAAPEAIQVLDLEVVKKAEVIDISLPADLFQDTDGDALTYRAQMSDGSDLPSWLIFDESTLSFSGSADAKGLYQVVVIASDGEAETSVGLELMVKSDIPDTLGLVTVSTESIVNDLAIEGSSLQGDPQVASLPDGSYVIAFTSFSASGSSNGQDVYFQRYSADGVKQGGQTLVNTTQDANQNSSDMVGLDNGNFIITWSSYGQDGEGAGVYFKVFSADGSELTSEIQANVSINGNQNAPSVTQLANGNVILTWSDYSGGSEAYEVTARIFDVEGNELSDEFMVNSFTDKRQNNSEITALEDGGFLVSWESDGQDGSWLGLYAQRFDSEGQPVGDEFIVNDQILNSQEDVSIAGLVGGGFVAVWESTHATSGDAVYFRLFDENGVPVGPSEQAFGYTSSSIGNGGSARLENPSVTALADGGFVIVSEDDYYTSSSNTKYIVAQRYYSDGSENGRAVTVNGYESLDSSPEITETAIGDLIVVWQGMNSASQSYDIFTSTLSVPGNDPGAPRVTQYLSQYRFEPTDTIDVQLPTNLFMDPNGDDLTITATLTNGDDLPDWLNFDPATMALTGSADGEGWYNILISATDGTNTVGVTTRLQVNRPPELGNTFDKVQAHLNEDFYFHVPHDLFTDPDGDYIGMQVRMADGSDLPDWLSLHDSHILKGSPERFEESILLEVIGSDGMYQISHTFELEINVPVWGVGDFHRGELTVGEDQAIQLGEYAFRDENGSGTLAFSFEDEFGNAIDWLSIEQGVDDWIITGTHGDEQVGYHEVFLTASDGHFERTLRLDIDVMAANAAPVAGASDLEVVFAKNQMFKAAPQELFSDPEGDALTYSVDNLPNWLYFNTSNGFMMSNSTELYDSVVLNIEASDGDKTATNTLKVEEHNSDWTEQAITFDDGQAGRILVQDEDGDSTLQAEEALVVNETLANAEDLAVLRLYQVTSTNATQAQFEADMGSSNTIESIAQSLVESLDFVSMADTDQSGDVSNDELIAHLYDANHGRSATTAEQSYWQNRFNTDGVSQGDVVAEFASSDEYVDVSTEAIANVIHQNEDWWS